MRIEMLALCMMLSGSIALTSCAAQSPDASEAKTATGGASWPSCHWPAAVDPDPSGSARDHCIAARTRLSCALPNGVVASCTTDDPARCPGADAPDPSTCHADCAQNEYSAQCGGIGPGAIPDPPAGCRLDGVTPAGIAFYCCACT